MASVCYRSIERRKHDLISGQTHPGPADIVGQFSRVQCSLTIPRNRLMLIELRNGLYQYLSFGSTSILTEQRLTCGRSHKLNREATRYNTLRHDKRDNTIEEKVLTIYRHPFHSVYILGYSCDCSEWTFYESGFDEPKRVQPTSLYVSQSTLTGTTL